MTPPKNCQGLKLREEKEVSNKTQPNPRGQKSPLPPPLLHAPSTPSSSLLQIYILCNPDQLPTQVKTIQESSRTPHFPSKLLGAKPPRKTTLRSHPPRARLKGAGSPEWGFPGGPHTPDELGKEHGTRVGLKEGSWGCGTTETEEERDGQEAGTGRGEDSSTGEAGLRGKEPAESGTQRSKSA